MEKTYKVTHKVYYNDRLNKVLFHGKSTYPLYIQVTFDRKTTFFKSNFFELLSKPKYGIQHLGKIYGPDLKDVIAKEEALIEFVVDKNLKNFSLEVFRKEYEFYSRDLLDEMEDGFRNYLYTFFHDEGMPWLAESLKVGSKLITPYDVVYDMKIALKPSMHEKMIENSFHYGPPYYVLYEFSKKFYKSPPFMLPLYEWAKLDIKEQFVDFMNKFYPDVNVFDITKKIGQITGQ